MALLAEPEFWARLLGIGVLNLLLSGDNALVIALAVRALPPRQRLAGQIWGALGAVALRVVFVAIVTLLLQIPLLQLAGGLLLLWIAVRLVRPDEGDANATRHGSSVWEAVWIIIVADITMSLDNVLAIAAAARGEMILVVIGIALSLPIVVWGAGLLAGLMNRWGWIVWLGGGFLAYVALEMVFEDKLVVGWLGATAQQMKMPISLLAGAAVAALGWWLARRPHAAVPEDV
ncbi:MAG TPA: YjbE family putative metal transport protein [Casimicrobiaceae bacterium]|jgi:YjbE family integral membrane protein|nr:YjbE family putative metal transport protein [Casimicrobiaceae bacterium]